MADRDPKKPQKPYSEPTFVAYGKVRDLTKVVATRGQPDGGTSPRDHTSVT